MEKLMQSCNDTEKQSLITAQNSLIQFYFDTLKTANNIRLKEENTTYPDVNTAQNAVRAINKLCVNKKITPAFKGKATNIKDIFQFAQSIVERLSEKIDADMRAQT